MKAQESAERIEAARSFNWAGAKRDAFVFQLRRLSEAFSYSGCEAYDLPLDQIVLRADRIASRQEEAGPESHKSRMISAAVRSSVSHLQMRRARIGPEDSADELYSSAIRHGRHGISHIDEYMPRPGDFNTNVDRAREVDLAANAAEWVERAYDGLLQTRFPHERRRPARKWSTDVGVEAVGFKFDRIQIHVSAVDIALTALHDLHAGRDGVPAEEGSRNHLRQRLAGIARQNVTQVSRRIEYLGQVIKRLGEDSEVSLDAYHQHKDSFYSAHHDSSMVCRRAHAFHVAHGLYEN